MDTFEGFELGETDETIQVDTREQNRLATTKMAQQSRRTIEIISRELDPVIYDTVDFVEAIKKLAISHRHAKIRILVFAPKAIVRRGHRLVDLAKILSSFISIYTPSKKFKNFNESLFIADKTAYVHRLTTERFEGTLNFNDKRYSKNLLTQFEKMWNEATPDANLRRMHI